MPKKIKIPCPHCAGTGKKELPTELKETLKALSECGKEATVDGVFSQLKFNSHISISRTGVNNRLNRLHKLNLVTRQMKSREWVYSL